MRIIFFLSFVVLSAACNKSKCNKNLNTGNEKYLFSEITCPKCRYKKIERMPTDVCVITYTCKNCKVQLHPKDGDCCVFCTYGNHKCPSKE